VSSTESARKALETAEAEFERAAREVAADEEMLARAKARVAEEPGSVAAINQAHAASRVAARSRARLKVAEEHLAQARETFKMLDIEDRLNAGADVTYAEAVAFERWNRDRARAGDPDRAARIDELNTLRVRYGINGRALTLDEAARHPKFDGFRSLIAELRQAEAQAENDAAAIAERLHSRLRGGE